MKRVQFDERREILVAKTEEEAYDYFVQIFTDEAKKAVSGRGCFSVALSGGNTPLPFYEKLREPSIALMINWSLIDLFWGDERCVAPTDSESNFGNALPYFSAPPLDLARRHRLAGEAQDLDKTAREYEVEMKKHCSQGRFDLVILGLGEDGHTASLFPHSPALKEMTRLFVPNEVAEKKCSRLTLTYPALEQARSLWMLAFGRPKAKVLKKWLFGPTTVEEMPCSRLGTKESPIHILMDRKAAYGL